MKILKHLLFIFCTCLISESALAAWSGLYTVKVLKVQHNGTYVVLEGFVNIEPTIVCENNAFFALNTTGNYKERTSFLLAAYMSGKPVNISYYGCNGSYLDLGSVQFSK